MTKIEQEKSIWWGSFNFQDDEAARWSVGPTTLWIYRSAQSWHLLHSESEDPLLDTAWIEGPMPLVETDLSLDSPPEGTAVTRFSFSEAEESCSLSPALADRAVVVRPDIPLYILGGERVTIYVSTPLWMRVAIGAQGRLLQEIPSFRPSDTWFGSSTREGELCYAVRTAGRLRLENVPRRLHRAITPVRVINRGSESMHVDRIQVPVQYLSLFEGDDHFLWTQTVVLDRQVAGDHATVHFDDESVPDEAGKTTLLSGPRNQVRSNMIVRTFSSLFQRSTSDS